MLVDIKRAAPYLLYFRQVDRVGGNGLNSGNYCTYRFIKVNRKSTFGPLAHRDSRGVSDPAATPAQEGPMKFMNGMPTGVGCAWDVGWGGMFDIDRTPVFGFTNP